MASFTVEDQVFATLMAYREARGEGDSGITAVLWVAKNNAIKKGISIFTEVTTPFRYSSINAPVKLKPAKDPNYQSQAYINSKQQLINSLSVFAKQANSSDWTLWQHINDIVISVLSDATPDITNGATLYYSDLVFSDVPPDWDRSKIVYTTTIGHQKFYREI